MKTKCIYVVEIICTVVAIFQAEPSLCFNGPQIVFPEPLEYGIELQEALREFEPVPQSLVRDQCRMISGPFSEGCECSSAADAHSALSVQKPLLTQSGAEPVSFASQSAGVHRRLNTSANLPSSDDLTSSVALRLHCSCHGDQTLELGGISVLPQSVLEIFVSDCRGGVVTLTSAPSSISDSSLKKLKITNVKNLTIEKGALDLNLVGRGTNDSFSFVVENVGTMNVQRGAVRLSGKRSSIEWENIVLSGLPSFSITAANLSSLKFTGVLVTAPIETAAINLESSGTSLVFDKVDARVPVDRRWISGDARELTLTHCRLNLAPGAFQQIFFTSSNPNIVIRNNVFGDARWHSKTYPSLASRVFEFSFVDGSAVFNFTKNKAQCSAGNLEFITEHKKSNILHWLRCGLLKTLICLEPHLSPVFHSCQFESLQLSNVLTTTKSPLTDPEATKNSMVSVTSRFNHLSNSDENEGTSLPVKPMQTTKHGHYNHRVNTSTMAFSQVQTSGVTSLKKARSRRGIRRRNARQPAATTASILPLTGSDGISEESNTFLDADQWIKEATAGMAGTTAAYPNGGHTLQMSETLKISIIFSTFVPLLTINWRKC